MSLISRSETLYNPFEYHRLKEVTIMRCPNCGSELKPQSHFWPDPDHVRGLVDIGLPKDWYSYSNEKPQDGGRCRNCYEDFIKIKNGDIYIWTSGWHLFEKLKNHRKGVTPIGGRWVQ